MRSLAAAVALGLAAFANPASAQSWQPPQPNERCPSKWDATDERGSANLMKPASVLRAAQLITTGETFELAHVLGRDISRQSVPTGTSRARRTSYISLIRR